MGIFAKHVMQFYIDNMSYKYSKVNYCSLKFASAVHYHVVELTVEESVLQCSAV